MKILKYLILINSILFSQSPDSLFHLANGYYVNEDFEDAIIKYEQLAQIYENEDLYLNLGNSYFKIGQLVTFRIKRNNISNGKILLEKVRVLRNEKKI